MRAELHRRLWWALDDFSYWVCGEGKVNGFRDRLATWIDESGKRVLCLLLGGHKPVRDQCGIPEHDFCIWCGDPMPHAADKEPE